MKTKRNVPRYLLKITVLAGLLMILPGWVRAQTGEIVQTLLGIITFILFLVSLGVGVGAFGFLVNHIFKKRSGLSYKVICLRPGLSFLVGLIITVVGLGLLIVFNAHPKIQLIILLAYLVGLLLFAVGSMTRVAAHFLESPVMQDDLPSCSSHIKSGMILHAINLVPILGTLFFTGVLLAGVGAALLSYFASMGGAVAALAASDKEKPSSPISE